MRIRQRLFSCSIIGLFFFASSFNCIALPNEAELKAAFIFNLVKYTDWPGDTLSQNNNLILCYIGAPSALGTSIADLHGKHLGTHAIEVRATTRLSNLVACHVVVLGQDIDIHLFHRELAPSALIIGEGENFVDYGGGIGLYTLENRIRFDVNLNSTRANQLRLSAHLLRLARNIRGAQ